LTDLDHSADRSSFTGLPVPVGVTPLAFLILPRSIPNDLAGSRRPGEVIGNVIRSATFVCLDQVDYGLD
jgi:hypothetical protein